MAIEAAQWCEARAPGSAACDYALAQALGQQARERPSTSRDGLAEDGAGARARGRGRAGPRRRRPLPRAGARLPARSRLAARAGGSRSGPRRRAKAVALAPDHPPNQLALAEALARNGRRTRRAPPTTARGLSRGTCGGRRPGRPRVGGRGRAGTDAISLTPELGAARRSGPTATAEDGGQLQGEAKKTTANSCRYAPDGSVQKTLVSSSPAPSRPSTVALVFRSYPAGISAGVSRRASSRARECFSKSRTSVSSIRGSSPLKMPMQARS